MHQVPVRGLECLGKIYRTHRCLAIHLGLMVKEHPGLEMWLTGRVLAYHL